MATTKSGACWLQVAAIRNVVSARTEVRVGCYYWRRSDRSGEVMEELVVEKGGFELSREPVELRMGVMCFLEWAIVGGKQSSGCDGDGDGVVFDLQQ